MTDSRQLSRLVESAEDFAAVLRELRDDVPRDARRDVTDITGAIGELYRLSNVLQLLRDVYEAPRYEHRVWRIRDDAGLVCRSAQRSVDLAMDMVGRASEVTQWMVWDDLAHRMGTVERMPLLMRLKCYYDFTQGLLDQLEGYQFDGTLERIKGSLIGLDQQQSIQQRSSRLDALPYPVITSSPNTSRPQITMPTSQPRPRTRRPVSDYTDPPRPVALPPPAPEAPPPQSPQGTWSSTRTYVSSDDSHSRRTSYSSYDPASTHWASYIFGGNRWRSRYRASSQVNAATRCNGSPQVDAKFYLSDEGFVPLESVTFVDNNSILTFYYRPRDSRARLLFTATDPRGQKTYYCTPLNCLRAIRSDSILQLCMARNLSNLAFWPWAELKFIYHERMVLFYSTFVALKRQDLALVPEPLIEDPRDMEEATLFSGVIRDREMFHALRLLRDSGSGVLRLEARSYRGDKEEVPIWTAFLSKYRDERDRDVFCLEGGGVVSMICPKPKPYIFVQEYGLPCLSSGDFALQFLERDDAKHLIEIWTGLCNAGKRS